MEILQTLHAWYRAAFLTSGAGIDILIWIVLFTIFFALGRDDKRARAERPHLFDEDAPL